MPADLNRVTLVGRLTRDPELRHTAGGEPICSMRLAVNSRSRDEGGDWTDKANFFDVTLFGRRGETVVNYMSKGSRIGVDGRLSWREWQAQDGTKRQNVEVIANDVFFLDSRGESGGFERGEGLGTAAPAGGDLPVDRTDMQPAAPADDDIPF